MLRVLCGALMLQALMVPVAVADEPPEAPAAEAEPGLFDAADAKFGEWVVGPLASVMFYDVMFWDNTLPLGDGIGSTVTVDDVPHEVVSYEEGGYVLAPLLEGTVEDVVPVLETPVDQTLGTLTVTLSTESDQLVAKVREQTIDVSRHLLALPEGAEPPTEPVLDDTLAPFPVQVDVGNAKVLAMDVPAAHTPKVPLVAGMTVRMNGATATILASEEDGKLRLKGTDTKQRAEALANPANTNAPAVVVWLVLGATILTLWMRFINLRGFWHGIQVTTGKYDDPDDPGEISHFQALTSALSATVGLGNIAGVAIAIQAGGPGAVFWMVVAAFLGMSSKFTECTLGQMYRTERSDGSVSGGPMHYLADGLAELGYAPLGKVLSVLFALMCIGGSLGGGNMFQANQSYAAVAEVMPIFADYDWLYGILLAFCVGLVIIGGIRRIGTATSFIVPIMCGVYILAGLYILAANASAVPMAFGTIVTEAFSPTAVGGGVLGVLVIGFQRASFSNEAGVGSASIAHSAAATHYPVREGLVALLEPFIDTVMVCTMTGLVVVVTGVYTDTSIGDGVLLTSRAFGSVLEWFPVVLSFAVVMFAFSTMISWSYYGERCATFLFGEAASLPYKVVFLFAVFFGSVIKLGSVLDFSDLMVLGMAFPNILGLYFLAPKVKAALDTYLSKLAKGEFDVAS
jgi:AGCS family alanine or glycine:cation symporter